MFGPPDGPHLYERLIALGDSDADAPSPDFARIDASSIPHLKALSTRKFRDRWNDILARYAQIDDATESDEIDLATGRITVDNGHLRSLGDADLAAGATPHSSIWAEPPENARQAKRGPRKLPQKASRLGPTRLFGAGAVTEAPHSPSADSLEDNLSILSSPVKRHRSVSLSPLKALASPRGSDSEVYFRSPSKASARTHSTLSSATKPEYLLTDMTVSPDQSLFTCAFRNCPFHSASKTSYRSHLLSRHTTELHHLGYPVTPHSPGRLVHVPEVTLLRLNLHFPTRLELPPAAPYVCGMAIGELACQRTFLHLDALRAHKKEYPELCHSEPQVFLCPLLGCEFMTDAGYQDYVSHVASHRLALERLSSDKPETIADYFSDAENSDAPRDSSARTINLASQRMPARKSRGDDLEDGAPLAESHQRYSLQAASPTRHATQRVAFSKVQSESASPRRRKPQSFQMDSTESGSSRKVTAPKSLPEKSHAQKRSMGESSSGQNSRRLYTQTLLAQEADRASPPKVSESLSMKLNFTEHSSHVPKFSIADSFLDTDIADVSSGYASIDELFDQD